MPIVMITLLRPFLPSVFLIPSFILISIALYSQNTVGTASIRIDATFNHIAINHSIINDDNRNSSLTLRYRPVGTQEFLNGAMTMRAYPGMIVAGEATTRNFHAGSIMFLLPDTSYEIECVLTDPDGGLNTTVLTASTKAIPEPDENGTERYVAPGNGGGSGTSADPFLGLQAAADNAQPGDRFVVASGTYAPFALTANGTLESPISFLSEIPRAAVIEGGGTNVGVITLGTFDEISAHVIIDGFTIQNGARGIDAQNTQFVTIRNCIIQNVDYGYVNRREFGNEQDQYINNNLIIGNTAWPQTGTPNERGVDIRGNRNVVSFNTIRNFGDGISTDGPVYELAYALDIHNNDIINAIDDLIEVDGIVSNTRIYANRCFNGRAGVSLAPIYGGPAYVFRNILYNLDNSAFKMNRSPSGMVVTNNTIVSSENAFESPDGWQNTFYRNNVMIASRYCFEMFGLVAGSTDDWDYGAFYSSRGGQTGTEWFKWNNIRYATVPVLQSSGLLHANAIEIAVSDFENVIIPEPYPVSYEPSDRDFTPTANAPVINSGTILDQLNDGFVSDGLPDRGAIEFGVTPPRYGHLFDNTTNAHIVLEDVSISIYPNPFIDRVVLDGTFTNYTIQVFNVMGQQVADYTGASAPLEIDLTSLGTGIYFVNVSSTIENHLSIHTVLKE